jgi:hypothetical protein
MKYQIPAMLAAGPQGCAIVNMSSGEQTSARAVRPGRRGRRGGRVLLSEDASFVTGAGYLVDGYTAL